MIREEQIIEAGIDFTMRTRPVCRGGLAFEKEMREFNRSTMFEAGAKWADEHPKERLVSINKVEKYLKEYIILYVLATTIDQRKEWFDNFRKAMEE